MRVIQHIIDQNWKGSEGEFGRKDKFSKNRAKRYWKHINPGNNFELCNAFDDVVYFNCLSEGDSLVDDQDDAKKIISGSMVKHDPNKCLIVIYIMYLQIYALT